MVKGNLLIDGEPLLIPDDLMENGFQILRSAIRVFKGQPRDHFDPVEMQELATSIKESGQWTPIAVRRLTEEERKGTPFYFELVDGERRHIACGMAGKLRMRASIVRVSNRLMQFKMSFLANLARAGHSVLEIAKALDELRTTDPSYKGLTVSQQCDALARFAGKSKTWAFYHLQVLDFPKPVLQLMDPRVPSKQRLGLEGAIFIASLKSPAKQLEFARKIASREISVKQARASVDTRDKSHPERNGGGRQHKPAHVRGSFENVLRRAIGDVDWLRTIAGSEEALVRVFAGAEPELREKFALKARIATAKFRELAESLGGQVLPEGVSAGTDLKSPGLHRDRLTPHPSINRRDINDYKLTDEEVEFVNAVNDYKKRFDRRFPSNSEMLHILKGIGYARKNGAVK